MKPFKFNTIPSATQPEFFFHFCAFETTYVNRLGLLRIPSSPTTRFPPSIDFACDGLTTEVSCTDPSTFAIHCCGRTTLVTIRLRRPIHSSVPLASLAPSASEKTVLKTAWTAVLERVLGWGVHELDTTSTVGWPTDVVMAMVDDAWKMLMSLAKGVPFQAVTWTLLILIATMLVRRRSRNALRKRLETLDGEKNYDVHVRVISAVNLPASDATGASDPYVAVEYANLCLCTGMRIQTLHPSWNETLQFPVSNIGDHREVVFNVYDWDLFSADDFLGKGVLQLRGHVDITRLMGDEVKVWIPLTGVPKAKLQVGVKVTASEKNLKIESAAHVQFLLKRKARTAPDIVRPPPGYLESSLGLPGGERILEGGFGASILANKQLLLGTVFVTDNYLCFQLSEGKQHNCFANGLVLPLLDIVRAKPVDLDVVQPSIPGIMVEVKPKAVKDASESKPDSTTEQSKRGLDNQLEYLLLWSMHGAGKRQMEKFGGNKSNRPVQLFFSEFRDGWKRTDMMGFFGSVVKHVAEMAQAEEDSDTVGPLLRDTQPELVLEDEIAADTSSLWTLCYDNDAKVQKRQFEKRREFDIDILPWKVSPEGPGILMRSLKLKSPIRIPFAPPVAHVKKRQRCLQSRESFTIEEASVTPNVPYGDCFVVESTWKFQNIRPKTCKVEVYVGVYFTKSTMMKGKIKSNSISSLRDASQLFLSLAKEEAAA